MTGNKKQIINWLLDKDDSKNYDIKEHKNKRTLNQNAYFYELETQLAAKLKIPQEELHFELIKKSCPFVELMIPENSDLRPLGRYFIKLRQIVKDTKNFDIIRVYAGSSELNTNEMAILLDNLIEECKLQGIETITENELAKIRSLYETRVLHNAVK